MKHFAPSNYEDFSSYWFPPERIETSAPAMNAAEQHHAIVASPLQSAIDRAVHEHASLPRNPSFPKRAPALDFYTKFGEECANRNLIPSYRLFEHWMATDVIATE